MFSEVFPGDDARWLWDPALGLGLLSAIVIAASRGKLGYNAAAQQTMRAVG